MSNDMPSFDFINQAAVQNDRWWFLALVIVGASSAAYALRYVVVRLEAANSARIDELKGQAREADQLSERLGQIIERNTAALQQSSQSNNGLAESIKDLIREVGPTRRTH